MKIPFLDLKSQYLSIKDDVNPAIQNVLDNTAYVLGPAVKNFEDEFASKHQTKHCVAVSSGTDANHLVLWALDLGPGDEVIIPANTFIATAWGATLCGATPVFVDCEKDSYNIDPQAVEKAITPRTKAIVAVHLYGQPADMDPLIRIGKKHNIPVVEDAAQAHNAEYKGKKIGGLGLATSFSFYPGKNLGAYGEGGAVLTNDDTIANKAKSMRDHGALEKYNHEIYGHNYRMEGIQGAVLGVKLKHLDSWTDNRRRVANLYNSELSQIKQIKIPREMDYAKHVYHLYVVRVEEGKRDQLRDYLAEKDIATGLHYPIPLHLQKCFSSLGYKQGDFPVSEKLASTGLSLPIYPELTDEMVLYVCNAIKSFYL
ncbi:MAG: DegT/DnrJ/EryC1/StrS family aminotransferase [Calditrichae bacterium]|nr:DegT/DnrJ/EryC1/StrS family aminotransferase [Calditrichota bacterium]MCB9058432.1 DegT/DnrJ/EryC1/StrS family aminotransferase [Calditrichia bacterium]